jgi:hypothetical protein
MKGVLIVKNIKDLAINPTVSSELAFILRKITLRAKSQVSYFPVLRIRIRIHRIHMFLGLLDPDPDPSIIMQK